MGPLYWILPTTILPLLVGGLLVWRPLMVARRKRRFAEACRHFHCQRERLEAKFVQLGATGAKSEGPRWSDCFFDDDVAYARSRSTGELSAFVAVTIEMDDFDRRLAGAPDAVGNLRSATAVFRFDGHHWETEGRAIFNLTPTEAIHFYQRDLELMGQEVARRV